MVIVAASVERGPKGDTYNIRIRGCGCHIFGSEIQLVSHILGYEILPKNFPCFWVKFFSQSPIFLGSAAQDPG